jgi:hypothetical protein
MALTATNRTYRHSDDALRDADEQLGFPRLDGILDTAVREVGSPGREVSSVPSQVRGPAAPECQPLFLLVSLTTTRPAITAKRASGART